MRDHRTDGPIASVLWGLAGILAICVDLQAAIGGEKEPSYADLRRTPAADRAAYFGRLDALGKERLMVEHLTGWKLALQAQLSAAQISCMDDALKLIEAGLYREAEKHRKTAEDLGRRAAALFTQEQATDIFTVLGRLPPET